MRLYLRELVQHTMTICLPYSSGIQFRISGCKVVISTQKGCPSDQTSLIHTFTSSELKIFIYRRFQLKHPTPPEHLSPGGLCRAEPEKGPIVFTYVFPPERRISVAFPSWGPFDWVSYIILGSHSWVQRLLFYLVGGGWWMVDGVTLFGPLKLLIIILNIV